MQSYVKKPKAQNFRQEMFNVGYDIMNRGTVLYMKQVTVF